jgi:hypothetical protein
MPLSQEERRPLIEKIRSFPAELKTVLASIPDEYLTARPRPAEWSIAQVVHHLADAHMNAYVRFKLVLVEDYPTFKPYEQVDWAETPEAVGSNVQDSVSILQGLHNRWTMLMDSLTPEQWERKGLHPDLGEISLEGLLEGYERHGRNHLEQIDQTFKAAVIQRTQRFFKCVFPGEVTEDEYSLLSYVLYHHGDMSYRQIAVVMSQLRGGYYLDYLYYEYDQTEPTFQVNAADAQNLWQRLLDCGFKEWNG